MAERGDFGIQMRRPRPLREADEGEGDDAFFADLLQNVNKRMLVWLRDGRTMIGDLRSVDQFGNLVLADCVERIYVEKYYGDLPRNIIVVRGETLVTISEFDVEKDENSPLQKVSEHQILNKQREQHEEANLQEQKRKEAFKKRGLHYDPKLHNRETTIHHGEDLFNN